MMSVLPDELKNVFTAFENNPGPLCEHDVSKAVNEVRKRLYADNMPPVQIHAEAIAFDFYPDYRHEHTDWETYYGPQMVFPGGDGKALIYPHISDVTTEMLDYWEARATEARHPVLRIRYADLVWDFSRKVRGCGANVDCAHMVIDATIETARGGLCERDMRAVKMLERALNLCLSINEKMRLGQLVRAIIEFEQNHADTGKPGTWGYSFDLLVENKKVPLNSDDVRAIIAGLEEQLAAAVAVPEGREFPVDHFAAQAAAERLARFYRRRSELEDMARVLRSAVNAVLCVSRQTIGLVACAWLRKCYDLLLRFGLQVEADAVAVEMRNRGATVKDEMACISHSTQVSQQELDQYLDELLAGDEDEALVRWVRRFIPDPEETAEQVQELAASHPLLSLTSHSLVDDDGREVARVGSVHEDMDGRLVRQMAQNMSFVAMFLNAALRDWIRRYGLTPEKLTARLLASPLFPAERRELLQHGVAAYVSEDHLAAVHLLVPQVEAALRLMLATGGRSVYRKGRHGGLALKPLGELLRDPLVAHVFTEVGRQYLQVLLTDQRGWNLRNDVCHGMSVPDRQSPVLSDRVLHVLFLFSLVRAGTQTQEPKSGGVDA